MKLISFSATWPQILNRSKQVTRRLTQSDWLPGERRQAVKKIRGLKPGESVERGPVLECVSNKPEKLCAVRAYRYWEAEMAKEGFPEMDPLSFVRLFCKINPGARSTTTVNRIEFKYVDGQ